MGVYREEIFGPSLENTYWRFLFWALKDAGKANEGLQSWKELKNKCEKWTAPKDLQSFPTSVQNKDKSDECAIITVFSKSKNNNWGKYLGYFNTFNTSKWRNRNILYSDDTSANSHPDQYRRLFEELKRNSTEVKDEKLAKPDDWHPSKE